MAKTVAEYIDKNQHFSKEIHLLRELALALDVEETIKWGAPTYTVNGKNVFGIGAFKAYVGIWFFNGVFLKDTKKLLVNAQEEKTKAMRQMRFNSIEEMDAEIITKYLQEAIDNQLKGKELKVNKTKTLIIPELMQIALDKDKEFNTHFNQLTPGKQREYADYISDAKQEKTKVTRLEKIKPMIINGVGLHDKYKNC